MSEAYYQVGIGNYLARNNKDRDQDSKEQEGVEMNEGYRSNNPSSNIGNTNQPDLHSTSKTVEDKVQEDNHLQVEDNANPSDIGNPLEVAEGKGKVLQQEA